jgi:hypothetical protein
MTQMQSTLHVECCILAWLHHLTEQTSKPLCPHKHPLQQLSGWCTHCLISIIRRWWLNCVKNCSQVHRQVAEKTTVHLTVGIVELYTFTWTGNYIRSYVKPRSNTTLICYLQRNVNLVWFNYRSYILSNTTRWILMPLIHTFIQATCFGYDVAETCRLNKSMY